MSSSGNKKRKVLLIAIAAIGLPALLIAVRLATVQKASKPDTQVSGTEPSSEHIAASSEQAAGQPQGEAPQKLKQSGVTAPIANVSKDSKESALKSTDPATAPGAPLPSAQLPSGSDVAKAPAPVATEAAPPQGCVTIVYNHKKTPGHTDDESCSQHKNLIRIPHEKPTSVCVRVNKVPVRFQLVDGKANEILVGSIAGPKSEITARYCFGKATCKEDCTVPKDEFMDAIGGSENDKLAQAGHWDPSEAGAPGSKDADVNGHLDNEMKRELDNLDRHVRGDNGVFRDWVGAAPAPACGTKASAAATAQGLVASKGTH